MFSRLLLIVSICFFAISAQAITITGGVVKGVALGDEPLERILLIGESNTAGFGVAASTGVEYGNRLRTEISGINIYTIGCNGHGTPDYRPDATKVCDYQQSSLVTCTTDDDCTGDCTDLTGICHLDPDATANTWNTMVAPFFPAERAVIALGGADSLGGISIFISKWPRPTKQEYKDNLEAMIECLGGPNIDNGDTPDFNPASYDCQAVGTMTHIVLSEPAYFANYDITAVDTALNNYRDAQTEICADAHNTGVVICAGQFQLITDEDRPIYFALPDVLHYNNRLHEVLTYYIASAIQGGDVRPIYRNSFEEREAGSNTNGCFESGGDDGDNNLIIDCDCNELEASTVCEDVPEGIEAVSIASGASLSRIIFEDEWADDLDGNTTTNDDNYWMQVAFRIVDDNDSSSLEQFMELRNGTSFAGNYEWSYTGSTNTLRVDCPGTGNGSSSGNIYTNNADCTALDTPHDCCTDAGTGDCNAWMNMICNIDEANGDADCWINKATSVVADFVCDGTTLTQDTDGYEFTGDTGTSGHILQFDRVHVDTANPGPLLKANPTQSGITCSYEHTGCDNFAGDNFDLWQVSTAFFTFSSHYLIRSSLSGSTYRAIQYSDLVPAVNHYAVTKLETMPVDSDDRAGVVLRMSSTADTHNGYLVGAKGTTQVCWSDISGGATITDIECAAQTFAVDTNDYIAAEVSGTGNDTVVKVWINASCPNQDAFCTNNWGIPKRNTWGTPDHTFTINPSTARDTVAGVGLFTDEDAITVKLGGFYMGDAP